MTMLVLLSQPNNGCLVGTFHSQESENNETSSRYCRLLSLVFVLRLIGRVVERGMGCKVIVESRYKMI